MTYREALRAGTAALNGHRCEGADAAREAEALLSAAARAPRERFFAHPEGRPSAAALRRYRSMVAQRRRHAPLAYLLGGAWFMGREFAVDRRALVPRPATEIIVAEAIAAAASLGARSCVDVGTGTGCVAISLALGLPGTEVVAVDVSSSALALARSNARRHRVGRRVRFLRGDLAAPAAKALAARPSVIVANLPYIPAADMRRLPPCVLREPRSALAGGRDGLDLYRRLLGQLAALPRARFALFAEILPAQYGRLRREVLARFPRAAVSRIANGRTTIGLRADARRD